MQVTKCDRCGALYEPTRIKGVDRTKGIKIIDGNLEPIYNKNNFPNCSRLCLTNRNIDYDLCEKCTEEFLASFKGE